MPDIVRKKPTDNSRMATPSEYRASLGELVRVLGRARIAEAPHHRRLWVRKLEEALSYLRLTACMMAPERLLDEADHVMRQCEMLLEERRKEFRQADLLWMRLSAEGPMYV